VQRVRGQVPNLHAALAASEPALRAYMALGEQLAKTQLTTLERQVVMMEANHHNGAPYCMAGHSAIAHALGMPPQWVQALRDGVALPDARAQALRDFSRAVLSQRGAVSDAELAAFEAAGYGREHALEVVLAITLKTLSNFTSRMGALPNDVGLQPWAWSDTTPAEGAPDDNA
jgi:alkylhydroperoxidase family enzyme